MHIMMTLGPGITRPRPEEDVMSIRIAEATRGHTRFEALA
jgi:hypothetical protein